MVKRPREGIRAVAGAQSQETLRSRGKESKYVFKARMTDNLLDYSHKAGKQRRSTFYWQWQLARKNASNYARK